MKAITDHKFTRELDLVCLSVCGNIAKVEEEGGVRLYLAAA